MDNDDDSDVSDISDITSIDSDSEIEEKRNLNCNDITKIQLDTVSKIVNMFPKALERHKKDIINSIIGNTDKEEKILLTKVNFGRDVYYRYRNYILLDNKCKPSGVYYKIGDEYCYYPFKETEKKYKTLKNALKNIK